MSTAEPDSTADFSGVGRGLRWSATGAMLIRIAQFLMGIVAARLIAPSEFGAFAVATTIYGVVATLSDMGVTQAILREVHRTKEIGPTVMTLNMGATLVLAGLMAGFARPLSEAFGTGEATTAVQVLAATMVLGGLGSVPAMVLARDYRQQQRFYSDASNFVVSSALLVILALAGWGVMALAWSRFIGQAVSAVVLNVVVGERYGFGWNTKEAGALLRFSLPLALAMSVNVLITNVDTFAVGRLRGATDLGYYNLAFTIAAWPIGILSQIMLNITTTTFARSQGDITMLRFHLRSLLTALWAIALPGAALIIGLATPLITAVSGMNWAPAAAPLIVLGFLTVVRLVQALLTDFFTALGMTRWLLRIEIAWFIVLVPVMLLFVNQWGYVGAALAHVAVGALMVIPAFLVVAARGAGVGLSWIKPELIRPVIGSALAGLAAHYTATLIGVPLGALAAGGIAGVIVYLVTTGLWLKRHILELRDVYTAHRPATTES